MTRKHYKEIADAFILASLNSESEREVIRLRSVANVIANQLQADNSRFDRARFMTACGL